MPESDVKRGKDDSWLHFRMPASLYSELKDLAQQERRSISQMARVLVEDGIEARRQNKS